MSNKEQWQDSLLASLHAMMMAPSRTATIMHTSGGPQFGDYAVAFMKAESDEKVRIFVSNGVTATGGVDAYNRTASLDEDPLAVAEEVAAWLRPREAKLPKIKFHSLRHIGNSMLAAKGVSVSVLQERGGWSSPRMPTETYRHLMPGEQAAAADLLDDLV